MKGTFWSNESVLEFSCGIDPVAAILELAQKTVLEAMEKGWSGPPFDPFELAKIRDIAIIPKEDVAEARLLTRSGRPVVEYNPLRPSTRIRYSVAHEIAHTLFGDFDKTIRHRRRKSASKDEWQLEMLCNLAAAEFLMPLGTLNPSDRANFDIERVLEWRKTYAVSTEAMLLRLLRISTSSLMVFCASTMDGRSYHWDYALDVAGPINRMYGQNIRRDSPISNCVAIGYVDKGRDQWPANFGEVNVECVGVPAYPGAVYPRVVGFARRKGERSEVPSSLKETKGNALSTRGEGRVLLVHVVNNKARSWGAGFGKQLAVRYPKVAERFRSAMESRDRPRLGSVFSTSVDEQLTVVQLVAQSGYGESETPRLRYVALKQCLRQVREMAKSMHASVRMPPIGTGYGGAPWEFVKELIEQELVRQGVAVTVYRLRDQQRLMPAQPNLF